jgi:glycosyltransferase involved in cell wall biosynthesis
MKVSFVSPHFGYIFGGAEVNDLNLGKAFKDLGHQVTYFFAYDPRFEICEHAQIVSKEFINMRYWYDQAQRAPGFLGKLMRRLFTYHFLFKIIQQKKRALQQQDIILLTGRALLSRLKQITNSAVIQSIRGVPNRGSFKYYKLADNIIFWGGCETGHPKQILNSTSAILLDAAIEQDIFYPDLPKIELRQKLKGHSNGIVLIFTGRLDPIQQVHQIISSCRQLIHEGFHIRIVIVGSGHVQEELKNQAKNDLPSINYLFLGRRPRHEIGDLLRASDIFVINPKFTSYSLSLLEALACGTFSVAPRTGKIAKSLNSGDRAAIFPPNNPEKLTAALRSTIISNAYQRGSQTWQSSRALHTWQDNAEAILSWYHSRKHSFSKR